MNNDTLSSPLLTTLLGLPLEVAPYFQRADFTTKDESDTLTIPKEASINLNVKGLPKGHINALHDTKWSQHNQSLSFSTRITTKSYTRVTLQIKPTHKAQLFRTKEHGVYKYTLNIT